MCMSYIRLEDWRIFLEKLYPFVIKFNVSKFGIKNLSSI